MSERGSHPRGQRCTFCEIVAREAPASIVYEDDRVLGIMDVGPVNPGHAMVIPREHVACLADVDEATWARLCAVARRLAQAIRACGVRCEGINLFLADGEAAFQEILHLHLHVFPRYEDDAFELVADWSAKPPRAELDAVAARIRRAYDRLFDAAEPLPAAVAEEKDGPAGRDERRS